MAKAEPGRIYATADVLDRSDTEFDVEELEPFTVKGKARPVQAWVVGEAIGSRGQDAGPGRFPLLGREHEVAGARGGAGLGERVSRPSRRDLG